MGDSNKTYKVNYGYTFDENGNNVPMVHEFETFKEASNFASAIFSETKIILCIYQD